ncbi:MAG TPA: hypothetical protein VID27_05725, partial [Blastocatellia bacterium]
MNTRRIGNRYLAALCAIVTLTLGSGAAFTGARAVNPTAPDLRSDLSGELRTLESFSDELFAFNKQCAVLGKKPSVLQTEIDPLQRKSVDLKGRLSGVQSAILEIIRKLKAANVWDDLDQKLLAATSDAKLRAFFQRSSFKSELEEAAAGLGSQANEISAPLDNLRRKLKAQTFSTDRSESIVRVSYSPATPVMFLKSLGCRVGQLRVRLILRLGGVSTGETND